MNIKKQNPFFYAAILILLFTTSLLADEWGRVKWVLDGDTIILEDDRRIRYIGINAPEVAHGNQPAEPYGDKAKEFNKALVSEQSVRLEFDRQKYDQYGRTLAYVFLKEDVFINAKLLKLGYAYCLPIRPNNKYESGLLRIQQQAMTARRGMWKNWHEADTQKQYIGNARSKRFHHESCRYGKQISQKNRIYFSTQWDAFFAGFSPCKACKNLPVDTESEETP